MTRKSLGWWQWETMLVCSVCGGLGVMLMWKAPAEAAE